MANRLEASLAITDANQAFNTIDKFYDRLQQTNEAINDLGANSNFARQFSGRLEQVEKQADRTRRALSNIANTRTRGNALDGLAQSAARLEKETRDVQARLVSLRRAAARGGQSRTYLDELASDARIAERRLISLQRRSEQLQARSAARTSTAAAATPGIGLRSGVSLLGGAAVAATIQDLADIRSEVVSSNRIIQASAVETGIAYRTLKNDAKAFGDEVLLSNRQAEATFAQIVNFANAAGRIDKLEEFRQRFADLAAAKGIQASQLGDISRQLNALTDEATDKLLNANPSAFFDEFAESVGKTAGQLTDAEKRAAVFDAVLRRGAIFDGEASRKANDFSGDMEVLSKRFSDFRANVSGATEPLIGFLRLLSDAAAGAPIFGEERDPAAERARSLERARQAAERLRASDRDIADARTDPLSSRRALALSRINDTGTFFDPAARQKAFEDNLAAVNTEVDAEIKNIQQRLNEGVDPTLIRRRFEEIQRLIPPNVREKIRTSIASAVSAGVQAGFQNSIAEADNDVRKLREILSQVSTSSDLDPNARRGLVSTLTTQINAQIDAGKARVRELREETDTLFNRLFAQQGATNPFVKVFTDAENAIDQTRKSVAFLSDDLQQVALNTVRAQNAANLFTTRLNTGLQAVNLRSEAERFENPERTQSAADRLERQIELINRNLNPGGSRSVSLGSSGLFQDLSVIDPTSQTAEQRRIADQRIIELTRSLDPAQLTDNLRGVAADARIREAERLERAEVFARENRVERLDVQKSIDSSMKTLVGIAESDGLTGVIRIVNDATDVATVELGQRPNQADTQALME